MIVEFRDQNDETLRTAGMSAIPRTTEAVRFGESEYTISDTCWNISPGIGSTNGVDVTIWLE